MKILVTGGAGFQGSHLSEKWVRDGHQVTILSTYSEEAQKNIESFSDSVSIVWGSVTDREIVEKTVRGQEVVAHLAAHVNVDESLTDPRIFHEVNIGGTINVLEAVKRNNSRMIFASSCEVYGYSEESPVVTESSEMRPYSPYAASKAGADRMCFAYYKGFGVDVTVVRPCNIYGERQKSGRGGAVIPIFCSLAAAGKPLTVFGEGTQKREYMHVQDLIEAYDLVLRRDDVAGEVLNAGTGENPSIIEIAKLIGEKTGASIVHKPARPGEVPGFALDSSKINRLGFSAGIRFEDGLARYIKQAQALVAPAP